MKVFVKSVNWVGDAVLVTPTLRVLRRALPEARITLLARPAVAPVFECNPDIDRLWVAPDNKNARTRRAICARMRDEGFDLGFSLPNSFGAAWLLWRGGVRRRVGYPRDGRGLLLTDRIPLSPEDLERHEVEYYLNLLRPFCNVEAFERRLVLEPAPDALDKLSGILDAAGIADDPRDGRPWVGIAPGAAYGTAKRWPHERYAALARHIAERHGARILLQGGPGEAALCDRIADEAGHDIAVNLAGRYPLRGLIALLDRLRLFVSNDSGAMHLAVARGLPVVALWGPTDWRTTAPYGERAAIVRAPGSCDRAPCLLRDCPIDHRCMNAVSVEDAAEAVDRLWPTEA